MNGTQMIAGGLMIIAAPLLWACASLWAKTRGPNLFFDKDGDLHSEVSTGIFSMAMLVAFAGLALFSYGITPNTRRMIHDKIQAPEIQDWRRSEDDA